MTKTHVEQALADQFALALPVLPGGEAVRARRQAAFAAFEREGLPSRRLEAWHYTDLRNRMQTAALPVLSVPQHDIALGKTIRDPLDGLDCYNITMINGAVVQFDEMPPGLEILSMRTALASGNPLVARMGKAFADVDGPMVALNTAMFSDGIIVRVRKGVRLDKPLKAACIFGMDFDRFLFARSLLIVEEGASATFIDTMVGTNGVGVQSNAVVEVQLDRNAKAEFIRLNASGDRMQTVTTIPVSLESGADFNLLNMTTGAELSRSEVRLTLRGEHAKLNLSGVSLLKGNQHNDNTLVVDHVAPNCESRELFRSVVDDEATGVFQGKIIVRQAAQKTDGRMASNAVLLSDNATMNNKPELEIFADDVQCAHGATCGALDEDLLFYLQARGLPKKEAEALMLQAFVGEVLDNVSNDAVRGRLNEIVEAWLKARAK